MAPDSDEDDFEYELEEADPEVLAHAKRQATETMKQAESAIDVDQIYRELDQRDDFDGAFEEFRARFSLRSLLWVITGISLLLGLGMSGVFTSGAFFAGLILVSVVGLGVAHAWLNHREKQRRAELLAKRAEQLRAARRVSGEADRGEDEEDDFEQLDAEPTTFLGSMTGGLKLGGRLSLAELMIAMVVASVVVVLLSLLNSPARAAGGLGAVAVIAFALQAAEVHIPRPLLLAWWLALVGFCLLTVALGLLAAAGWALGVGV